MPRLLGNAWDTTVLARVGKRSTATPPSESPVRRLAHPTPPKVAEPDRVYAKGQLLARGSYGMVFKARTGTGAEVCLKEVPLRGLTQSELIQTFQEADLLKALRSGSPVGLLLSLSELIASDVGMIISSSMLMHSSTVTAL